jgi:hypothetical protein
MKEKGLKYLRYLSLTIGLSFLGVVFIYYAIVFSASVGILTDQNSLIYIQQSIGMNISQLYCNLFFMMFSLGSLGAILTYIGLVLIPKIIKEYL